MFVRLKYFLPNRPEAYEQNLTTFQLGTVVPLLPVEEESDVSRGHSVVLGLVGHGVGPAVPIPVNDLVLVKFHR